MFFSDRFICAGTELCNFDHHVPAPYLRKSFLLDFAPEKAEIVICGLGFYRLWINGKEITKGPLAPYISNPGDICYYDHYDLADQLVQGENVIGIQLGNGFRNCFGGMVWDFEKAESRGPVCTALYFDASGEGKSISFEADESFRTHASPVTFDDLRMGCRYDARLEIDGWNLPGFRDDAWAAALPCPSPKGAKRLCTIRPIENLAEYKPVSVTHYDRLPFGHENASFDAKPLEHTFRNNVYVFDFGINTAGVTRLHIQGKPGQKITIRHGEQLSATGPTMTNILFFYDYAHELYLEYNQVDEYICKGGDEIFEPVFKYDGFRYCFVEGLEADQITDDLLVMVEQSSGMDPRADFVSSCDSLNRLQVLTRRSDRANFFYFPTDCPHREKNGWTGDASVSSEHMLLNLTCAPLLAEWLANIRAAQTVEGVLPGIVPTGGWGFAWGNGPAWDAVCVNLPYYAHRFDGDTQIICDNADMILRYLAYAATRRDERGLAAYGLGDWVAPITNEQGEHLAPLFVTDTLMLLDISTKAARLFEKVDMPEAADKCTAFAFELRTAFRKHLVDFDTMTVAGNCQTSQSFALYAGIFEDSELPAARARLLEIVRADDGLCTCGMVGRRYLYHELTRAGAVDLAYELMVSTRPTNYGHWLANDATALWEDFYPAKEKVNSRNHHFMGDISSWFIQDIAGVRPNPDLEGINTFEIAPHFVEKLTFAEGCFEMSSGTLRCRWERDKDSLTVRVTVPAGTHGKLTLSDGFRLEDGTKTLVLTEGIHSLKIAR